MDRQPRFIFHPGKCPYQFPKLARELAMSPYMIGLLMSCIGLANSWDSFSPGQRSLALQ